MQTNTQVIDAAEQEFIDFPIELEEGEVAPTPPQKVSKTRRKVKTSDVTLEIGVG